MHVIIVGCGRVGASTAAELARAGHDVVVIDRNPDAFRLLPGNFSGRTLVGTGFDRDVLESAGIREADALVASAGGDNTNAVAARVAKEVYRVPDVVARIFDPRRADIYRRYGVQTFAPTAWSVSKIVELIVSPSLEREMAFGNGEVQLLAAWVPVASRRQAGQGPGDPRRDPRGAHRAHGQGHRAGVGHGPRKRRPGVRGHPSVGRREVPEDDGVEVMRIVIAGAGTLGRRVANYTRGEHDVLVIEQSRARAHAVEEELGVKVLVGDADEPAVLFEAGVDRADVFVASTGHDEDNLVASLLAKNEYKVRKVIAAVRNPRNRWLYNRSWGVDVAIDSAEIVTKLIEEEATLADVVTLLDLHEGEVTVSSMMINEDHGRPARRCASSACPRAAWSRPCCTTRRSSCPSPRRW